MIKGKETAFGQALANDPTRAQTQPGPYLTAEDLQGYDDFVAGVLEGEFEDEDSLADQAYECLENQPYLRPMIEDHLHLLSY